MANRLGRDKFALAKISATAAGISFTQYIQHRISALSLRSETRPGARKGPLVLPSAMGHSARR